MDFPRHKLYQRIAATVAEAIESARYLPGEIDADVGAFELVEARITV